jgi:hypothetical protein
MSKRPYVAQAVLFGLLTSIAFPAAAQNPQTPELHALNTVVFANPNLTKYDENWRRSVAGALYAWCEDLRHRTPRNTPAEHQWVDAEFADALRFDDEKRIERLENSVEYARHRLAQMYSGCSSSAKSSLGG